MIEAVYCDSLEEYKIFEKVKRELEMPLLDLSDATLKNLNFDGDSGITISCVTQFRPSYVTGSKQVAEDWEWYAHIRKLNVGTLEEFLKEKGRFPIEYTLLKTGTSEKVSLLEEPQLNEYLLL